MEFAKKYLLVDPSKYEKLVTLTKETKQQDTPPKDPSIFSHPNVERVHELDNEMKEVLDDSSMSDFDKAMKYGEKLHSYLGNFRTALTTPKVEALIGQRPVLTDKQMTTSPKIEQSMSTDKIISAIPKTYHSKAAHLLNFMKANPNISWGDDGKIMYKDKVIENSNVNTLVGDMIRLRKPQSDQTVVKQFLSALETEGYSISGLPRKTNRNKPREKISARSRIPVKANQRKSVHKYNKGTTNYSIKPVKESDRSKTPASEKALSTLLTKWKSI